MLSVDALITLGVILLLLLALIRELLRPDFLFMGALAVLLLAGVLTPSDAFSGFSNQAVFTVGALFVIAAGIQKTRALQFADQFIFDEKSSPRLVMIKMMGTTAAMSGFLNNTPIVAMLMPQVQDWAERTGNASSRLLIPLSYAAISGGIITLIGTSTNLIVSGMLEERGMPPLGFFELTWIGLPAAIIIFIYFATIGYSTLPDRSKVKNRIAGLADKENERDSIKSGESSNNSNSDSDSASNKNTFSGDAYQFDLMLPPGSPWHRTTVDKAGLRALEDVFLLHVRRNKQIIGPVGPDFQLEEYDVLTFAGDFKSVDKLAERKGLERSVPQLEDDKELKDLPVFEAVVAPSSPLVGNTLKGFGFRERYRGVVVGIQRKGEVIRGALGHIKIRAGDLLLVEAKEGFGDQWNSAKDEFYVVNRKGQRDLPADEKAPIALITLAAVIVPAAFGLIPIVTTAFAGAIIMVLTGCVKRSHLFSSLNLPILIVIAAAIGLGRAMDSSGLAEAGAGAMLNLTSGMGLIAFVIAVYVTTNILTEVITNNAAAVLMVPLGLSAAATLGIDPHLIAVTVAVAASASFLTPIGYQTNLMVMSAGGYRFTDYFKAGLPVTFIFLITTVIVVSIKFM